MNRKDDDAWKEAQRRCRLSDEEVRMARELGFKPKSLMKNIPSPSQKWKAPVGDWVRDLYEEKVGSRKPAGGAPGTPVVRNQVIEFRNRSIPGPTSPRFPNWSWKNQSPLMAVMTRMWTPLGTRAPSRTGSKDHRRRKSTKRTPGCFAASVSSAGLHSQSPSP